MMDVEISAYVILTIIFCLCLFVIYLDLKSIVLLLSRSRHKRKKADLSSPGRDERRPQKKSKLDRILARAAFCLTVLGAGIFIYGYFISPNHLTVTKISLPISRIAVRSPLKIAHISDLHFEKSLKLHGQILEELKKFAPDMILLTGDYVNEDRAEDSFRKFSSALSALAPVYAVDGNWDSEEINRRVFSRTGVRYLEDELERIEIRGTPISLVGITAFGTHSWKKIVPDISTDTLNIMLTHSPDMIPDVASSGKVDFYFCGHTHGGQVRLPFYGALITLCDTGKRYEMGLYREGKMIAYTNRGVGMEGGAAPRIRFLSPPELALFTISRD